jgi:16S rRNA (adenine1518-N6/adenine1519-N6)-dimethyltransferase
MVNGVVPNKALGQNFLMDSGVAQVMVASIGITNGDWLIEVGSGTGALTHLLGPMCTVNQAHLNAVEFDIDLIPTLTAKVVQNEYVTLVNANILTFLDTIKVPATSRLKLIGSLPYNITSPLMHRLVHTEPMPETCVFLIQKEVAQKICKIAPRSNYLSVFVQTFFTPELLQVVDKKLFSPIPQVDGAVVKLTKKSAAILSRDVSRYEKYLHRVFFSPRKMLNKVFTPEELKSYHLDGTKRPQDYSSDKYLEVFNLTGTAVECK